MNFLLLVETLSLKKPLRECQWFSYETSIYTTCMAGVKQHETYEEDFRFSLTFMKHVRVRSEKLSLSRFILLLRPLQTFLSGFHRDWLAKLLMLGLKEQQSKGSLTF